MSASAALVLRDDPALALLVTPATVGHALDAVRRVVVALGLDVDADRASALAILLCDAPEPWTVAALDAAARALSYDVWFRETVRFGGTVTPADFERMRSDEHAPASVQAVRLHTYAEAVAACQKAGATPIPTALFEMVPVEGGKPLWRPLAA